MSPPIRIILRGVIAGLLAAGGLAKAGDPAQFAVELTNYRLLPPSFSPALALYLPWLELVCALGLLSAALRRGAWLLAVALGFGFVVFVSSAWLRGLDLSCGCLGGLSSGTIDDVTVTRTAAFFALAITGFMGDRTTVAAADRNPDLS